jgi:hypothetical protein
LDDIVLAGDGAAASAVCSGLCHSLPIVHSTYLEKCSDIVNTARQLRTIRVCLVTREAS